MSERGLEEEVVQELWAQGQEQREQSEGGQDEAGEGAQTGAQPGSEGQRQT